MLERTQVFVDTSYLLATFYNSWQVSAREQLEIELHSVVQTLHYFAKLQVNQPVQRQNWYDGVPERGLHRYQEELRKLSGVQFRAGKLVKVGNRRAQKGVDTLLVADMIVSAYNGGCSDMVLVCGDADMVPGVEEAVKRGVRVHLIGFGWESVSRSLSQVCDTVTILDPRLDFLDCMKISAIEALAPTEPDVDPPGPEETEDQPVPEISAEDSVEEAAEQAAEQTAEDTQSHSSTPQLAPETTSESVGITDAAEEKSSDDSAGPSDDSAGQSEPPADTEQKVGEPNDESGNVKAPTPSTLPTPRVAFSLQHTEAQDPKAHQDVAGSLLGQRSPQKSMPTASQSFRSGKRAIVSIPGGIDYLYDAGRAASKLASSLRRAAEDSQPTQHTENAQPTAVIPGQDTPHPQTPDDEHTVQSSPQPKAEPEVELPQLTDQQQPPQAEPAEQAAASGPQVSPSVERPEPGVAPDAAAGRWVVEDTVDNDVLGTLDRAESASESTRGMSSTPVSRPNPSMMAMRKNPPSERPTMPTSREVWSSSGDQTPFDVGQQFAQWWFENANADERASAPTLTGGGLPPDIDRPLLQYACQVLQEFTLSEHQRVLLRDGFHVEIRYILGFKA